MVKILLMCLPVDLCACAACDAHLSQNAHFIFSGAGVGGAPSHLHFLFCKTVYVVKMCIHTYIGVEIGSNS